MKYFFSVCIIIALPLLAFSQTKSNEEVKKIIPTLWLSILDKTNSAKTLNIKSLNYYQIPKELDFKGIVVDAIKWNDKEGEKLVILSMTGLFEAKEYGADSLNYILHNKSEVYAYLFLKKTNFDTYSKIWRISESNDCYSDNWFTGFIPQSATITDLDEDGISELTLPYLLLCRTKNETGKLNILMYEGKDKYEVSGNTIINCNQANSEKGVFSKSDNLSYRPVFSDFLKKRWNEHQCENGRF